MKSTILTAICVILSLLSNAQKNSWTPYFPVRDSVIGHAFIGDKPLDSKVAELIQNVSVNVRRSATSFSKEQQRILEFTWNGFFSRSGIKVAKVEAFGVKLDEITTTSMKELPGGIPFVYAGLKADSCRITFLKSTKTEVNVDSLISSIKEIYPSMSTTELGQFVSLLKLKYKQNDSTNLGITIKDPSTYFMVQVAEYNVLSKSGWVDWKKNGSSFPDKSGVFVDSFTLNRSIAPFVTGTTKTRFSKRSKGDQADVWIKFENDGNLYAYYKLTKDEYESRKKLIEERGVWGTGAPILVARYPYGSKGNTIKYKDIYLVIDAKRDGNDRIIVYSGAKGGSGIDVLGKTYILYPEVRLWWKEFSLK